MRFGTWEIKKYYKASFTFKNNQTCRNENIAYKWVKNWLDIAKEKICDLEIDQKNYRNSDEHIVCQLYLNKAGKKFKNQKTNKQRNKDEKYKRNVKMYDR